VRDHQIFSKEDARPLKFIPDFSKLIKIISIPFRVYSMAAKTGNVSRSGRTTFFREFRWREEPGKERQAQIYAACEGIA
jgi:hypothetical protein